MRKSLVVRDGNNKSHYRLLETSRQFALDQLTQHDEVDSTRTRHSTYLTNLFRTSLDDWEKLPDRQWMEIYDPIKTSVLPQPRCFVAGPHLDSEPHAHPKDAFAVTTPEETRAAVNRFRTIAPPAR